MLPDRQLHTTYIGLGTNLGDRAELLRRSLELLEERVGILRSASSVIETDPVGFVSCHTFLNQVVELSTTLSPHELLLVTQEIERKLGRTHKSTAGHYANRKCDIDILLYDDLQIDTPELTIPHPRMLERDFVVRPLSEIAPELVVPGTSQRISEMVWDV